MERKGIDISVWNGANVDFNKLKSDGIEFVIIRAGYGRLISQKDKQFENNYNKAKSAGMPIGAYWYSYAKTPDDAKLEAQTCLEVIKGKQFEYPIYFDFEDPSQTGLTKDVKSDIVVTFCEALEDAGYYVGLYANLNWFNNYLDYDKVKSYTLWLAQWSSKPTYKNPIGMWQYTSDGTTSGTPGRTDMNIAYQDFPAEIKSLGLNGYLKETPETPTYKPVTEEVVNEVIKGTYGNGNDRKKKLIAEGYNYDEVQDAVNKKLNAKTYKPVTDQIVNAVINGQYGNGNERKKKLEAEGYVYSEVQGAVNKKLSASPSFNIGDKVRLNVGARWATGQGVPNWVYNSTLYVRSTPSNGKCQVSTLTSGAITGVAYIKDLTRI